MIHLLTRQNKPKCHYKNHHDYESNNRIYYSENALIFLQPKKFTINFQVHCLFCLSKKNPIPLSLLEKFVKTLH